MQDERNRRDEAGCGNVKERKVAGRYQIFMRNFTLMIDTPTFLPSRSAVSDRGPAH
jgi:hypothetical protein